MNHYAKRGMATSEANAGKAVKAAKATAEAKPPAEKKWFWERIPKWMRVSFRVIRVGILCVGLYQLGKAAGMADYATNPQAYAKTIAMEVSTLVCLVFPVIASCYFHRYSSTRDLVLT